MYNIYFVWNLYFSLIIKQFNYNLNFTIMEIGGLLLSAALALTAIFNGGIGIG